MPPGSGWGCPDLTAITGAPPSPFVGSGFVGSDRSTNVIIKASDGYLWSLSLVSPGTSNWSKTDLTAIAGGP